MGTGTPAGGGLVRVWPVLQVIIALWLLRKLLRLLRRLFAAAVLATA